MTDGVMKTWVSVSGNPRHADMDGETVPYDEPFSNGMMYPGDPAGGAEENANCTCVLEFSGRSEPPSMRAAEAFVQAERKAWIDGLTGTAKETASNKSLFFDVTPALRTGATLNSTQSRVVSQLDDLFAKNAYALRQETSLYRGFRGEVFPAKVGARFADKGYAFTTLAQEQGRFYAGADGWLVRIVVPEGTPVFLGNEGAEAVLARGTVFEVMKIEGKTVTVKMASSR